MSTLRLVVRRGREDLGVRVGMVVLRLIILVATPPSVSMPSDSGVTSRSRTSFTSPPRTPAWMAAPTATTSSGLTPLCGSLPSNMALTASTTAGMRVMPPTRITSSISVGLRFASASALRTGSAVFLTRSATRSSSLARVRVMTRCLGPEASAEMNGRLISVDGRARQLDLRLLGGLLEALERDPVLGQVDPLVLRNSAISQSMTRWSKSSPPRCVSPFVLRTSKTPSDSSRMLMSKVPPPRS